MDKRLSSVRVYYHIVTKSFTATMLSTFDVVSIATCLIRFGQGGVREHMSQPTTRVT